MKIVAAVFSLFIVLIFSPIWRGFVLTKLWAWFIIPTFGLPVLTIVPAIGLAGTVHFLTYQHHTEPEDDRDLSVKIAVALTLAFIAPLFVLGCGWVVAQFM